MPEPSIVALVRRRIALADIFYALCEGLIDDSEATEAVNKIEQQEESKERQ